MHHWNDRSLRGHTQCGEGPHGHSVVRLQCYSREVRKKDLIALAYRDWNAIAALRRHWVEQRSRMRPTEALHMDDELTALTAR